MRLNLKSKHHLQWIALCAHLRHETNRMMRIPMQVFLPSVITTALYFLIFGAIIGQRVGPVNHFSYSTFIAPGLLMISVITNAYSNTASSLFSARFQRSVEELLISPMHANTVLLGYVLGGVVRGVIVALLVFAVAACFVPLSFARLPLTLLFIILFSTLFSFAGFINGMLARNFEEISVVPTFILSPLTYLGGVFYAIDMLPPLWHQIAKLNPIVYMVNALRYAMIGQQDAHIGVSVAIIVILTIGLGVVTSILLKRGVGIRE